MKPLNTATTQIVDVLSGDAHVAGHLRDGQLQGPLRIQQSNRPLANLSYSAGQLQGVSQTYHPNGHVSAQLPYVADKLHGVATFYSAEGQVQRKAGYCNGLLHGEASIHYPNGQLAEREHFRDGVKDGLYERFHGNGQVALSARYLNGKLLYPAEEFAEDGRPLDSKGKPISRLRWWWMNAALPS